MQAQVTESALERDSVPITKIRALRELGGFPRGVDTAARLGIHTPAFSLIYVRESGSPPRKLHLRGAAPLFTWGREVYVGESIFT